MPKRKKPDETPIPSNVDLSSDSEAIYVDPASEDDDAKSETAANESALAETETDVPAEPPIDTDVSEPVNNDENIAGEDITPEPAKKRRTRKKVAETTPKEEQKLEDIPVPENEGVDESESNSLSSEQGDNEEYKEDDVDFADTNFELDIDNILDEGESEIENQENSSFEDAFEESDDLTFYESDGNIDQKGQTNVELAKMLSKKRRRRESENQFDDSESAITTPDPDDATKKSTKQDVSNKKKNSSHSIFGGALRSDDYNDDNLRMNEIKRYIASGTPLKCKIVSVTTYNNDIAAVVIPEIEKFKDITIYVPFSETDFDSNREYLHLHKKILLSRFMGSIDSVQILNFDSKTKRGEGSIRLGNIRRRKEAYFRGRRSRINRDSNSLERQKIEEGMVVNGYIQRVNKEGIYVNIFGAKGWIFRDELSHTYIDKVYDDFEVGQYIKVKILKLKTNKDKDYQVRFKASIKALLPDTTIDALNMYAKIGDPYTGKVNYIPKAGNSRQLPVVCTDLGFNCRILSSPARTPYTEGSYVEVQLQAKTKKYAVGAITKVITYMPQRNN